jgi:glycosyltransferase involved in cell wall biosynthesis
MHDPDRWSQRLRPARARGRLERSALSLGERVRDRLETSEDARLLEIARAGRDVCWTDEGESEPLVTIRIATFDRGEVVAERALATAVAQTYDRLEILVVGDGCDAATERAIHSVRDPRIRFVNLGARGIYPKHVQHRRMVAGSHPMNTGLALALGTWIAPCDDDDELTTDHVEVLLRHAQQHRLEMVFSRALTERKSAGDWEEIGDGSVTKGGFAHGSVLYTSGLRFMRYSSTSWKMLEPSDWNMWKRMERIGVRMGFCDHLTYIHYLGAVRRAAESIAPRHSPHDAPG